MMRAFAVLALAGTLQACAAAQAVTNYHCRGCRAISGGTIVLVTAQTAQAERRP